MLSKGCTSWKKCDEMCCEHGEPFKELQNQDPAGPPLDYMKQRRVFKAMKTNKYDLCHFYHMELSGNLPSFLSPHELATHKMLEELLRAGWALGHPNLLMVCTRVWAMVVCLLQELHQKDSLKHLPLEPKSDTDGKMVKKLSFCPFCLYSGSNDISYMNHTVGGHYSTVYGCGKCLKEVFLSGQQLKMHLKVCTGFPKVTLPPHLIKSLCHRVPRKAPRKAHTTASTQIRNQIHQGVQLSLQGSQVSQEVQESERGYTQEGEVGQGQGGQKVPQKVDLCHPHTSTVHHLRVMHTRSGMDNLQELLFLVVAFNCLSPQYSITLVFSCEIKVFLFSTTHASLSF